MLFATILQRGGRGGKLSADRLKPMFKTKEVATPTPNPSPNP